MRNAITLAILWTSVAASFTVADVFDRHTSAVLRDVAGRGAGLAEISMSDLQKLNPLSRSESTPAVVIRTDSGHWTKALISWGFRKSGDRQLPVLLIEQFVTYRDDASDVTVAAGKEVILFAGFHYDLDIGQVVPAGQGGDITFTEEKLLKMLGAARLWGIDGSQLVESAEDNSPSSHEGVLPRDFSGTWIVTTDGRWSGTWRIKSTNAGRISGTFTSDDTKSSYDLSGRVASPVHHARLSLQLDNAEQTIDAWLWTKDKSMMAGTATLAGQTFGFYAKRTVEQ